MSCIKMLELQYGWLLAMYIALCDVSYGHLHQILLAMLLSGDPASAAKAEEYVNLRDASREHQRADTSLEALYGDTAVWIHANNGQMGRRQAASLFRLSQAG